MDLDKKLEISRLMFQQNKEKVKVVEQRGKDRSIQLLMIQLKKARELEQVEKDRLKRIQKWCEEMVLDHHKIYIINNNNYNYYYYDEKTDFPIIETIRHNIIESLKKANISIDLVYNNNNYKVIITNVNLKRNMRKKIAASIELMVETGKFEYIEF